MNAKFNDLVRLQYERMFRFGEVGIVRSAVDDVEKGRERRGSIDDVVDLPCLVEKSVGRASENREPSYTTASLETHQLVGEEGSGPRDSLCRRRGR